MKIANTSIMRGRAMTLALVTAAALAVAAPAAVASEDNENLFNRDACIASNQSSYKFEIFFNSNYAGAYRNIGYNVYDFDHLTPGGSIPGTQSLNYCTGSGTGSGQKIKNNAASAFNAHTSYAGAVYFNSGFKGVYDRIPAQGGYGQFRNVYNQNASFAWR